MNTWVEVIPHDLQRTSEMWVLWVEQVRQVKAKTEVQ
jgi:hypothetical protein